MHKGMAEILGFYPETNGFKIDWLTLSFRDSLGITPKQILQKINQILEFRDEEWEHFSTGVMTGYNRSYRYHGENYISINYHDSIKAQGVNINITGIGTTILETEYLVKLIAFAISSDAYFTRFDVAYDDVEQALPLRVLDEINKRFEDDSDSYYNCGYSSICSTESLKMFYQGHKKYKYRGRSLSIGSRYSRGMIRIYNKAVEQKLADKYWYRIEIQTKYELAETLAKSMFGKLFKETFIEILTRYFRPVDFTSKCVTVSSIATNKKWAKFLEIIEETDITSLNSYCQQALCELPKIKFSKEISKDKYIRPKLGDFYTLLNGYYYYLRNTKIYRELIANYPHIMTELKEYLECNDTSLIHLPEKIKYYEQIIEALFE